VADQLRAVALGHLLQEEGGAALRALLGNRLLPEGELAVREAAAGPEGLAAARGLLQHLALLALRAGHAGRLGLRCRRRLARLAQVLALRVAGAAIEDPEAAAPERHRPAALFAGRNLLLRGRRGGGRSLGRFAAGAVARGRRGFLDVPGVLALGVVRAGDEGAV